MRALRRGLNQTRRFSRVLKECVLILVGDAGQVLKAIPGQGSMCRYAARLERFQCAIRGDGRLRLLLRRTRSGLPAVVHATVPGWFSFQSCVILP